MNKRSSNSKQFPSSKQASSSTKFWKPVLSTACPTLSRYPSGRKVGPLYETWGELTNNKWVLSIIRHWFRIPFKATPPLSSVLISLSQSSSLSLREEIAELLQKRPVERIQDLWTSVFYSRLFLVLKKNRKLRSVIDLSLLNQYIMKQPFKMETVKSVHQEILVCLHRPDRCLPTCSDSSLIQKVSSVHVRRSGLSVHGLTLQYVSKSMDFNQTDGHYSITPESTCHLDISGCSKPFYWFVGSQSINIRSLLSQRRLGLDIPLPRRLAYKRSNLQLVDISHKILPPNSAV